jgi:hypothetical protein
MQEAMKRAIGLGRCRKRSRSKRKETSSKVCSALPNTSRGASPPVEEEAPASPGIGEGAEGGGCLSFLWGPNPRRPNSRFSSSLFSLVS